MNIRKATIEDMETLIKLRFDFLLTHRGELTEDERSLIRLQLKKYFAEQINHNFIAIIAEIDNNVASAAFLAISERPANPSFITGKTGTLLNVFTYPQYRRMGIAIKVVSAMIDEARSIGVSFIDLSATEEGRPLYEKLGFIIPKSKDTPMRLQLI